MSLLRLPPPAPPQPSNSKTHHHHHTFPKPQTPSTTFQWNSLIQSHLPHHPHLSLLTFQSMLLSSSSPPNSYTLSLSLSASIFSHSPSLIPQLHAFALKLHLLSHPNCLSSLILSLSHFLSPLSALPLLSHSPLSPIPHTLLMSLLLQRSLPAPALNVFDNMLHTHVTFDYPVFLTAAKACGRLRSTRDAKRVYSVAKEGGFLERVEVGNAMVNMFLQCGKVEEARAVFEGMGVRDLVSWTTMVSGLVGIGGFNDGLKVFRRMGEEGIGVDGFVVSSVLPACGRVVMRKNGREVHGKVVRVGLEGNVVVGNALMDMYVKSGSVHDAWRVFERMVRKDVISWTVIILGFSLHGQGEVGVRLFKEMKENGEVFPDKTTYAAALHAANTACLVEEGRVFFNHIAKPEIEHCALMAGLLSRGRYFIEARAFVQEPMLAGSSAVHRAVLDGCRIHRNVKLGKRITEQLVELEPLNAENYVMLSNFYAANGKWEMVKELKETIRDMGLKTKKSYSWIEIRNKVHVFGCGDVKHPRSEGIYWEVGRLMNGMREEGYVAVAEDYSLHDVDEERECIPQGHSEMLAIGLGLISGSLGSRVLRITKNLRVCRNCHEAAKRISRIVEREIVLKDPCRFHHFKNGNCSCKDMW